MYKVQREISELLGGPPEAIIAELERELDSTSQRYSLTYVFIIDFTVLSFFVG
jgi:hypothetical protein